MRLMALVAAGMVIGSPVMAASAGKMVRFGPDSKFSGYFVRPEDTGKWSGKPPYPGLVVIHEWWGLNDSIKGAVDRLAALGYVALAVDLFGKSTSDPAEAFRMVRGLDQTSATTQMLSAGDYLRTRPYVKPDRVGSVGWCFGGGQSLILALNDPKLAAAALFYGRLVTDADEISKIKAAVLGIFGEADTSIPMTDVREFEKALRKAGVRREIYTYPNAGHAFASPTVGEMYRPTDAEDAWRKMVAFLERYLK
ncbi:MAG: dienelactone hydrolase family protein [Armatimonadota bacterium]|nr:dienelactone hydrolase family protein [Armatimonadota bacterium]